MSKITKKTSRGRYRLTKLLNKDIKELNGIILSLFCVSFLLAVGIISYKVNSSYAIFTDTIKGEKTIELTACDGRVNKPVLSENMIPVYYDEENNMWRKADSKRSNWYDYCNKKWANAVTITEVNETREDLTKAEVGTEIPMERINTMLVWIPRYKYTIWNYNSTGKVTSNPQEIEIKWEKETTSTGEIDCIDNILGTSDGTVNGTMPTTSEICTIKSTNQVCTDSTCNGKTYTHPAFTFGDEELTGFWVGKFEVSSDISCALTESAAIEVGCNITSIRPLVKPNVKSWRGAMVSVFENNMFAMNDVSNKYGFKTTDDTHVIKNMEWGAVAYLSHSKYGINNEVDINRNSNLITGCGPQSKESTSSGTTCNSYETELGQLASTSGNVYGIYDMSGGSYEYVMGNLISPNGTTMISGQNINNNNSAYNGILYNDGNYDLYTGIYEYPTEKYYDKYSFGTVNTQRSRSKLGDGIKEVLSPSIGWYSDRTYVAYSNGPWMHRGGHYDSTSYAGIFYSNSYSGRAISVTSSRLAISQSN